jgi:lipopolysaccharide transport system ATP-binding protein
MTDIAIRIENLSKQYRLGKIGTGTISHDLNRWWHKVRGKEDPYLKVGETNDRTQKGNSEYVWALRDIDFEVKKGEVLGIIGKNGAGKSTLLKVLSKVTAPTQGYIKTNGRIASLLEVGTGFHPEMTGRENIYMNGTIMGMTRQEITKKLDEIVDFSGVERYLDTPTKRYSSGMTVRLGFAIAAHLEPEILIVDEVLAVGDAEFQKKAIGKMQDVSSNSGRTVLFVSHNMGAVKSLCNKGLVLKNGTVDFYSDTNEAIDHYLTVDKTRETSVIIKDSSLPIQFTKITLCNEFSEASLFTIEEYINIKICYKVLEDIRGVNLTLGVKNADSDIIIRTWDIDLDIELLNHRKKGMYESVVTLPKMFLNKGIYTLFVASAYTNRKPIIIFDDLLTFEVDYGDYDISFKGFKWGGMINEMKWKTKEIV